jgi:hypothetical protein
MEAKLQYDFKRQSKNYIDWLLYFVKSEKYYEMDGYITDRNP